MNFALRVRGSTGDRVRAIGARQVYTKRTLIVLWFLIGLFFVFGILPYFLASWTSGLGRKGILPGYLGPKDGFWGRYAVGILNLVMGLLVLILIALILGLIVWGLITVIRWLWEKMGVGI